MRYSENSFLKQASRKRFYGFAIAFLLCSLIFTSVPFYGGGFAYAADETDGPQAYAVYTADNATLTFLMRDTAPAEGEMLGDHKITYVCPVDVPFRSEYQSEGFKSDVKTAVFDETIKDWHPTSTRSMFCHFRSLESVRGIENLKPGKLTDTSKMFYYCSNLKMIDLSGWDTSQVTDMRDMFCCCQNLQEIDLSGWDTSQVTDMSNMFYGCQNLQEIDLSGWDTSNVTNMSGMFEGFSGEIKGLKSLDTSKVTDMSWMFENYSGPDIDISGWDTSKVTDMSYMFIRYKGAKLDVSGLNTSSVTKMQGMFSGCQNLQEIDLSGWDTSNVTDMHQMFEYTAMEIKGLSDFDTSKVTDMGGLFNEYKGPDIDIVNWDTSKVVDMTGMFIGLQMDLDLSGLDTSNVEKMGAMFSGYEGTELDLSGFDTSSVTDMSEMFSNCNNLSELDLSGFKTTNVGDMSRMFIGLHANLNLSGFSTSNVTDMTRMFDGYSGKKLDLSGFHLNTGTEGADDLLLKCSSLEELVTPKAIDDDIKITLPKYMADEEHNPYKKLDGETPRMTLLTTKNIQQIDISNNDDISVTPNNGKEYRYTGQIIKPEVSVKYRGKVLTEDVDYKVSYMNTFMVSTDDNPGRIVIEGKDLFKGTIERTFKIIPADQIPQGETDPEADKPGRFYAVYTKGNKTLTFMRADDRPPKDGSLGDEPITEVFVLNSADVYDIDNGEMPPWNKYRASVEKVVFDKTMDAMDGETAESGRAEPVRPVSLAGWFSDFSRLSTIEGLENLDTSKVTDMNHMLYFCNELKSADVSSFGTSNVTDMSYMFGNCEDLATIDVSGFNTAKVTDMSGMFRWCQSANKIDVSGFDTTALKSVREMFYCCTELDRIDLSHFKTAGVTDFSKFLYGCADIESMDLRNLDLTGAVNEGSTEKMLKACVKLKELYTPKLGAAGVELTTELYDRNHNGYTKITNKLPAGTYLCVGYGNAKNMASKSVVVKIAGSEFEYTGSEIKPVVTVTCDGKKLVAGKDYTVAYSKNKAIGAARVILTGYGNYEGSVTKTFSIVPETFVKNKIKYEIVNPKKRTVNVIDIQQNKRVITIPASVTYKGKTYKTKKAVLGASLKSVNKNTEELKLHVEYISADRYKGFPNLKSVLLYKEVTEIGARAFKGSKKLKKVTFKGDRLKSIGKAAFKGINNKAVFRAPKNVLSKYKKKIKKAGAPKKAKYKAN